MEKNLMLPVGIESFEEIRKDGFYYIDKTKWIEQLLQSWGKVNLFTRPRRFGKTLNMSMLKSFFEIGTDPSLFDGLYISQNEELCETHMGKYPVICLSLKGVDGLAFEEAKDNLIQIVGIEAERFSALCGSERLSENERDKYRALIALHEGRYKMEGSLLIFSLQILSQLLYKHYGQKVMILIDEYDVPLDKAFQHGYYKEMVSLIRGIFGQALKTNDYLQFAVLTGCLRVSKESIFTGLNNFSVNSIVDIEHDEQFGFTDEEVRILLNDYELTGRFPEVKEWYDGYHFGDADVYCPWDVVNYVKKLRLDSDAEPQAYWINSSGNDLVKRFVDKADQTTKNEIEQLIVGDIVEKRIRLDLTYDEIDNSIDNVWSVLFTTGYLTQVGRPESGVFKLIIPNREVREVFVYQIRQWFDQSVAKNVDTVNGLYHGFICGKAEELQKQLTQILGQTISILDTKARDEDKENFYHGMLLGLLRNYRNWSVKSNVESGDGFADVIIKPEDPDAGIIIELKYARTFKELDQACERAVTQIKDRRYDEVLREDGRNDILAYGIAFCKKRCKVVVEKM
ncbi:MAG: AAA family ATPase [Lachnospiraceae bacterium]|nr:AAA family ATPase [Lachnospiraceae bacterium]